MYIYTSMHEYDVLEARLRLEQAFVICCSAETLTLLFRLDSRLASPQIWLKPHPIQYEIYLLSSSLSII